MLARDNTLILSFFRSQGMMAAPFIPLELDLRLSGARCDDEAAEEHVLALYSVLEFAADPTRHVSAGEIAASTGSRRITSPRCCRASRAPASSSPCAASAAATGSSATRDG